MEKFRKIKPYILYTSIFIIMAILVFLNFIKFGKSLIREGDGFYQHFVFMCNFSDLLKNVISNFSNGIPMFSWEMGLGLDIIGQYSYYVIGDPFSYIALLFKSENMVFVYNFTTIFRIYLSGITFILYARYHNKKNFITVIAGLMYAFMAFNLNNGILHPYFINAVIIFPIMLLAIDKLIKEDKIKLLIFVVFITAIMNYYFFYKITVIAYIYAIVKIICVNREKGFRFLVVKISKMILSYIIGVLMAAIILLPTIYAFLNSDRFGTQNVLYNLTYYENLLIGGKGFTTVFWVPAIVILTIPIAISKFKDKEIKSNVVLFIIETIMLLLPFIGSAMNGFSFPVNRWSFAYSFLLIYLFLCGINKYLNYSKKEILMMLITFFIYIILLLSFDKLNIELVKCQIVFLILYMIVVILKNLDKKDNKILKIIDKYAVVITSIIICINIVAYAENYFGIGYDENINNFFDSDSVMKSYDSCNNQIQNFKESIEKIQSSDKSFYRIGEITKYSKNESLLYGYKSLNSYLSVGNGYIGKLSRELLNRYYERVDSLNGFDNRTKITTLLANKYYITSKEKNYYVPYGYKLKEEIVNDEDEENPTQIYENENALPIGVFYDNYTLQKDYNNLTALEKEQVILDTAVVEDDSNINDYKISNNKNLINEIKQNATNIIPYKIIDGNELVKENKIETIEENQSIKLNINRIKNSELYVMFEGLEYIPYTTEELKNVKLGENYTKIEEEEFLNKYKYYDSSNAFKINIYYNDIDTNINVEDKNTSAYYVDINDKLVNLGYLDEHSGNIKITFSKIGKYTYNSIKIIAVPMEQYKNSITKLKNTEFELTKYNNNYLKGKIETKSSGILQLSTPYTKGWTAYVDGEKVDIINVNTAFIGIPLKEGKHEIYLKYETPYLREGIVIAIIGCILFVITIIYEKVKKNNK